MNFHARPLSRKENVAILFLLASYCCGAQSLDGVIDIHAHCGPDITPRSIDAISLAKLAKSRGMRGLVLKNHYEPTEAWAFFARQAAPGLEAFGGIDLNRAVGGVNAAAVERMARVQGGYGRVVWMPTFDSENEVRQAKQDRPFVPVSRNGELLPEVKQVIAVVAAHQMMLETGHSSAEEGLMIIREAKRQGVEHIVVTHAMLSPIRMSIPQMQEAARLGAKLEFVYHSVLEPPGKALTMDEMASAIRTVGPENCILSSDLGQAGAPLHPDGLETFFRELRQRGFSAAEIDVMAKKNPAEALGLGAMPVQTYRSEVDEWRQKREEALKADNGWLTLTGLTWLKEGTNSVGSDPDGEVVLPASTPAKVGTITLKGGRAHFSAAAGVPVAINGKPALSADLKSDAGNTDPDLVTLGSVQFFIIHRGTRDAVRIKDNNSEARRSFTGCRWYPVKPEWRIEARFVKWDKPKRMVFDTAVGEKEEDESPGYAEFTWRGQVYRLEATVEGPDLFIVFRDKTAGKTTYPASRFLKTQMPVGDKVVLDFNKAYNPPCVFTPYATCPLPVLENRLGIAIEAGELMYSSNARSAAALSEAHE
jgi:uncharacterized protein (DUF1684 family)